MVVTGLAFSIPVRQETRDLHAFAPKAYIVQGLPSPRDESTQPPGNGGRSEQLMTPPLDGSFAAFDSERSTVEDDDGERTSLNEGSSLLDPDDGNEPSTPREGPFWLCCGTAEETTGCMVESRHSSAVAAPQTWQPTWDIYTASQEPSDA
jgi:hypothetical protein